jgi:hypothetical protein
MKMLTTLFSLAEITYRTNPDASCLLKKIVLITSYVDDLLYLTSCISEFNTATETFEIRLLKLIFSALYVAKKDFCKRFILLLPLGVGTNTIKLPRQVCCVPKRIYPAGLPAGNTHG